MSKSGTTSYKHQFLFFFIYFLTSDLGSSVSAFVLGQPPRCDSQCAYDYIPVCGSDGKTYPNLCFLFVTSCRDSSLTMARGGPCVTPDPCDIVCTKMYDPVCGSDGVTYSNPCVLMYTACTNPNQSITRRSSGKCTTSSFTDPPFVQTAAPTTTTRPPIRNTPCPFGCTREYLPVCGSDGETYPNMCSFNKVACRNSDLTVVKEGPCDQQTLVPARPRCPSNCNKVYDPVCGSDGLTYSNICMFTKSSCLDPSITKAKDGPCDTPQFIPTVFPTAFPNIFTPATSISNEVPDRDSCRKECPFNYSPICGSDGITYTNKCTYDVVSCRNPTLKIKFNGSCF